MSFTIWGPLRRTLPVLIHMPFFKLLSQPFAFMKCMKYQLSGQLRQGKPLIFAQKKIPNFCNLLSFLSSSDPQRGGHDGSERPRGRVHIWRCEIGVDRSPKLRHASEGEQLSLPRAEAHRVCRFTRVPEARVGDSSQLSKGLHFTCKCNKSPSSS